MNKLSQTRLAPVTHEAATCQHCKCRTHAEDLLIFNGLCEACFEWAVADHQEQTFEARWEKGL